jgi:phosphoglycolate phosphatase
VNDGDSLCHPEASAAKPKDLREAICLASDQGLTLGQTSKSDGNVSNIFFDLDGTLVDPGLGISDSIQHALKCLGVAPPPAENLRWCVGPPLREIFSKLLPASARAEDLEHAVALYQERHSSVGLYQSAAYEGVTAMLARLCDGARLFVVTSKLTASAERILQALSLRSYFDTVTGSSPDGTLADKGDAVATILKQEKIDANSAAIVGDRAYDVLAGKRNGVFTIGVAYGYGTTSELIQWGADQICDNPASVTEFLKRK